MRKSLLSLAGIAIVSMVLGGIANAELDISELFDGSTPTAGAYVQLLNNYDSSWGYTDGDKLSCDNTDGGVRITFPVLYDSTVVEAPSYFVFLSPYRVNQLKSDDTIDASSVIYKEVKMDPRSSEVSFELGASDGIEPNKVYYGFVSPVDEYDYVGIPSKELCFQVSSNSCMLSSEECNALEMVANPVEFHGTVEDNNANAEHNSAGDNCTKLSFANFSYDVNPKTNVVTITWVADTDEDVDIAIGRPESMDNPQNGDLEFEYLKTISVSDEKFEYDLDEFEWNTIFNFSFDNGCEVTPRNVKVDRDKTTTKEDKPIVTPATGPAENILMIVIAAIVLYGAYAIFSRKSEN